MMKHRSLYGMEIKGVAVAAYCLKVYTRPGCTPLKGE